MSLPPRPTVRGASAPRLAGVALWSAAWLLAGCAPRDIDNTHGMRRGSGGNSVNGTAVLAGMFEDAGFRVNTWRRLSPKLEQAGVVLWAPDDFQPPSPEERSFLEAWLTAKSGRTLVYVGRDFDAAIDYWTKIQPLAPPDQWLEVARRLAIAKSEHDTARLSMPANEPCGWFTFRRLAPTRPARVLEGPWSEGVAGSIAEIQVSGGPRPMSPPEIDAWLEESSGGPRSRPSYTALLSSEDEPLVFRVGFPEWRDSKLLVVTNGSFVLNLPLVNREHRKLAGKLIAACGPPGRVVLLESGPEGLPILTEEPEAAYPTGLEMFTVWPLGVIVLHLAIAGITLCFARYPIFGRPRLLPVASTSDFGQHVAALGELLEKTGEREYAVGRLKYYNEHVKRDSGATHLDRKADRGSTAPSAS